MANVIIKPNGISKKNILREGTRNNRLALINYIFNSLFNNSNSSLERYFFGICLRQFSHTP